jgi:hypothetical protein
MLPGLGLVVGGLGGVFQGLAGAAGAANANRQAINNWVQGEMQKGINNGKELFNSSYAQQQQTERNAAIQRAAYLYQDDSLAAAKEQQVFVQSQISRNYKAMKGSLAANLVNAGTAGIRGGTAKALKLSQSLNFLNQAAQTDNNFEQTKKNIDRQTQNMLNQQRNDLILPNLQLASAKPVLQDPTMAAIGGALGGVSAGLSSFVNLGGTQAQFDRFTGGIFS